MAEAANFQLHVNTTIQVRVFTTEQS